MVDQKTLTEIAKFKEVLNRPDGEEDVDSDASSIEEGVPNRGLKLKRGASKVFEGRMGGADPEDSRVIYVDYNGYKRPVLYRKRKSSASDDEVDDDDDILADVKIEEILAPITDPAEVVTHKAISRTFTSNTLRTLAARALDVISEEQKNVIQFSNLMQVFLGDDPSFLLPDQLNLPDYDPISSMEKTKHLLQEVLGSLKTAAPRLDNSESTFGFNGTPDVKAETKEESTVNGDTNGEAKHNVNDDNDSKAEQENGEQDSDEVSEPEANSNKRITRTQAAQAQAALEENDEDGLFFSLPRIPFDVNYGISPENAEETRQLTQIALQRNEKFIRCMQTVRSGIVRADRLKDQIYRWCKEMAGDMDEQGGSAPGNSVLVGQVDDSSASNGSENKSQ